MFINLPLISAVLPIDLRLSSRSLGKQAGYDRKGRFFDRETFEVSGIRLEMIDNCSYWIEYNATIEETTIDGKKKVKLLRDVVIRRTLIACQQSGNLQTMKETTMNAEQRLS